MNIYYFTINPSHTALFGAYYIHKVFINTVIDQFIFTNSHQQGGENQYFNSSFQSCWPGIIAHASFLIDFSLLHDQDVNIKVCVTVLKVSCLSLGFSRPRMHYYQYQLDKENFYRSLFLSLSVL